MNKEELLRNFISLAKQRIENEVLRRWFCKKYGIPPTDQRYLDYTPEELLLEYLEDAIEEGRLSEIDVVDEKGRIVSDPVLKALEEQFEYVESFEHDYDVDKVRKKNEDNK